MQFVLILFILAIGIYRTVSSAIVLADFQQQALLQHNYQRQLHCVGPMILNSTLNAIAQNYSQYLAVNNIFTHSGTKGLGENLWYEWSWATINFINGSTPTINWYDEISLYNFNSPGFSSATGHFTQVIWKGSTQLGIGIALSSDNHTVKVVANYYPAGNVIGSFPANVPPLCSTVTTGSPTTTKTTIAPTTSPTKSTSKTTTAPIKTTTSANKSNTKITTVPITTTTSPTKSTTKTTTVTSKKTTKKKNRRAII